MKEFIVPILTGLAAGLTITSAGHFQMEVLAILFWGAAIITTAEQVQKGERYWS